MDSRDNEYVFGVYIQVSENQHIRAKVRLRHENGAMRVRLWQGAQDVWRKP